MELDLAIRGGQVVTAESTARADIGVWDGCVAAIASPGALPRAPREVDASGKLVMPGGVDPHTHIRWPWLAETSHDDFTSGTTAAAFGGTTTIIDYAVQKGAPLDECLARRRELIDGKAVVDFALTCTLTDSSEENLGSVKRALSAGIAAFKVYMIYRKRGIMVDDWMLFRMLEEARDAGALLTVHAESGEIGEARMARSVAEGRGGPWDFRVAKTNFVEAEAVQRAVFLAEELRAPLYVRHVSTAEGLGILHRARQRGALAFVETCPHYFTLTDDVYKRPDGHRFICSPPIKGERDRDAIRRGLLDGAVHTVGGDHVAFGSDQKDAHSGSFDRVPNGLPGIETRLPLTYTFGVLEGGLSLNAFVALVSTNAAKLFGLYPRKGTIAVGSDADLIVVDPAKSRRLEPASLHYPIDWNPYTGLVVRGFPDLVLSRGEIVVEGDRCVAPPGRGAFVRARPHGYLTV